MPRTEYVIRSGNGFVADPSTLEMIGNINNERDAIIRAYKPTAPVINWKSHNFCQARHE